MISFNSISMNGNVQAASQPLHKKWSFPLRISLVNVTKSGVSCGFGHSYWRNPYGKVYFVQWSSCQLPSNM